MAIKELLGKKIKNLRMKKGLTQNELASLIGISQRSLSGIEMGNNFLTSQTLEKILSCLNVSIEELFSIEHLKQSNELKKELIEIINNLDNEDKIKEIYKIIKVILKE